MKERIMIFLIFAAAIAGIMLIPGADKARDPVRAGFPQEVRVLMTDTGEIEAVSAKNYIVGCLCAQIPINYEQEALNAQAAAAATYAMRLMKAYSSGKKPFEGEADISDDPKTCQPFYNEYKRNEIYHSDYLKYYPELEAAADYGLTHIITYEGEPICAVYHSVSAGRTCSSEIVWNRAFPYLKPVQSAWDKDFINYECVNEVTSDQARLLLSAYKSDIETPVDCAKWFTEMNANEDGYVISVRIGRNLFSGGDIWRIFGLRSTAFTVTYTDNIFTFTTKGYGHGAGLSQYGANEMARRGYTASEILKHYYGEDIMIG